MNFKKLKQSLFALESDFDKAGLARKWLRVPKNNLTFDQLKNELLVFFQDKSDRDLVVVAWISKTQNSLNANQFREVFSPLFKDFAYRANIAITWIREEQDSEIAYNKFLFSAKNILFLQDPEKTNDVAKIYFKCGLLPENILNLCKDLYPNNEDSQVGLLLDYIWQKFGVTQINENEELKRNEAEQFKGVIEKFITSLFDDKLASRALFYIRDQEIITFNALEIMQIASNRLWIRHKSIKNLLLKRRSEDSFVKPYIDVWLKEFLQEFPEGERFSVQWILKNKNLADIFSFHDFCNTRYNSDPNLRSFKAGLHSEVYQEIRKQYRPLEKTPFIAKEEHDKLKLLLDDDRSTEFNLKLPSMRILINYFHPKFREIIQPNQSEIDLAVQNFKLHFASANSQELKFFCDQILYEVLREKIAIPIINRQGNNLGFFSTKSDIFNSENNSKISQNFISPNGLIKALEETLIEKDFQRSCAKDFALTIIKNTVPKILESAYLSKRKSEENFAEVIGSSLDQLRDRLISSQNVDKKVLMTIGWLEKTESDLNVQQLKENLLPLFEKFSLRLDIVSVWIKKEKNPEKSYEKFILATKENLFLDEYCETQNPIAAAYFNFRLPQENIVKLCKDLYLNDEKSQAQLLLGFVAEKFLALGEVKNSEIEFLPEDFQENIRVEALNFQMMAKDFTDSLIDKELAAKISFDIKKFITELTNDFDQKPPSLSLNSPSGDKVLVDDNQRSV